MRKPGPKKRGSRIGFLIDPFRCRVIWFESRLEEEWATVLIVRPDVVDVREQQTVFYGPNRQKHTLDFVVEWERGSRTGYAVKYAADVKPALTQTLKHLAEARENHIANDFRILTERGLHPTTVANARLILSCCTDFDQEACTAVRDYLTRADAAIRLSDIAKHTSLGVRGYRAAVTLFRERAIVASSEALICPDLVVRNRLSASLPSSALA